MDVGHAHRVEDLVVRARDLGDAGWCDELRAPAERGPGTVADILAILAVATVEDGPRARDPEALRRAEAARGCPQLVDARRAGAGAALLRRDVELAEEIARELEDSRVGSAFVTVGQLASVPRTQATLCQTRRAFRVASAKPGRRPRQMDVPKALALWYSHRRE